jgi:hypothetical protein
MDINIRIDQMVEQLEALRPPKLPTKTRMIVKHARNIQCGDLIEFPIHGQHMVTGFSRNEDTVMLSCRQGYIATFGVRQKVRLVREISHG